MDRYSEGMQQESIRKRLRSRGSGYESFEISADDTIDGRFALQVKANPGKPAVVSDDSALTYLELDLRADSIRCALRRETDGIVAPIAILVAEPTAFVACALAVLKAAAFYIPLDPSFPENRNALILRESGARIILAERATQSLAARLASADQKVMCVDEVTQLQGELHAPSEPTGLAYIVFTSGSTGVPKGVMHSHRTVLQVVKRYTDGLYVGSHDRVSLLSSFSVTASVAPLLSALLNGATVFAFSVLKNGLAALADWLDAQQITLYHSVPSLFRHLMQSVAEDRIFSNIEVVRLGGDSVYKADWELFKRHCRAAAVLVNSYGCSEISSVARFYMDAGSQLSDEIVPVGLPLRGVEISVVGPDGSQNSVTEGGEIIRAADAVGEIVLRSPYLSLGYWNDSERSRAVFTTAEGVRSYRTGDLGSIRPGRGLVHVGRGDSQVKLGGFRVEIAEIEACLRGYKGVREAAVAVHTADHGERELIGFVELEPGPLQLGADIRTYMRAKLPAHMLPAEILILQKMPSTPNGKIDRGQLISGRQAQWNQRRRQSSRTPEERHIAEVWARVIKSSQIGIDDDFFALGGSSILALRVMNELRPKAKAGFSLATILEHPTIRSLAQFIDLNEATSAAARVPARRRAGEAIPLTFTQEMNFNWTALGRHRSIRWTWRAMRLCGVLDVAALEESLRILVRRHEALRTRIVLADAVLSQQVEETAHCDFEISEVQAASAAQSEREVRRLVGEFLDETVPSTGGPVFCAKVWKLSDREHVLVIALDHMISDRTSINIVSSELWSVYSQYAQGVSVSLPPVPVQFPDYAVWQRSTSPAWSGRNLPYWQTRLQGARRTLLFSPARVAQVQDVTLPVRFAQSVTSGLHELSRRERTLIAMTVLTAYAALIFRWCDVSDVTLPFSTAGRVDPEVEHTVGFFASWLWLRLETSADDRFVDLLSRVTQEYHAAYEHHDFNRISAQLPRPQFLANPGLNWTPRELGRTFSAYVHLAQGDGNDATLEVQPFPITPPKPHDLTMDIEGMLILADTHDGIKGLMACRNAGAELAGQFVKNLHLFVNTLLESPRARIKDILLA
jgi:amino acid adenylation domain-containing protein